MTKVNSVSIAVTRPSRTSDGAGGFTINLVSISGSPFAGRKMRRTPENSRTPNADGAGNAVINEEVFVFPAGTVIREDDICTVGGVAYRVKSIRIYTRSVQADVKAVT